MEAVAPIEVQEAIELGAVDTNFYGHYFFPKAFRQKSPPSHVELDAALESSTDRFVSAEMFRGMAKTTKLRCFVSKRIAYGISHTILFVGKSQDAAVKSVEWLMRAVEFNWLWSNTFNLQKGAKWTTSEVEIIHGTDQYPIRVIALGITGSLRGINIDDFRPDLIVVDDPCDEENTATPESRKKMDDLFFGALAKSLAPTSEIPEAKMVLLQTPLNESDLISSCAKDSQWRHLHFGCFTEAGESRWPERWSTKELLDDKEAHIARAQLPLWLREMECKVISEETAAFSLDYLQYWDILPEYGTTYIGIDPTPPPKDGDRSRITKRHDDSAIVVVMVSQSKVFLADYYITKSPDDAELINKIFEMVLRWRPIITGVETHLFQRMLKTQIDREQLRKKIFFAVHSIEDKRKKETRIRQAIGNRVALRTLYAHKSQREFLDQYSGYPDVSHDDILDALSIALSLINPAVEGVVIEGDYEEIEDKPLLGWRGAP